MTHNEITEEIASENRNYLKGEDTKGTSQPWEQLYFNHISLKIQSRCKKKIKKKERNNRRKEGGRDTRWKGRKERKRKYVYCIFCWLGVDVFLLSF